MSHPIPGSDYSHHHNKENRHEYNRRKGEALGKVEHFPKEYVEAKRGLRKVLGKVEKSSAKVKALNKLKN